MQFLGYFQSFLLLIIFLSAIGLVLTLVFSKSEFVSKHRVLEKLIVVFLAAILLNFLIQFIFPQGFENK